MRILVVDDDRELLLMLQASLRKLGHQVDTAPDGASALARFRAAPHSIVVCDWQMPGMDGPALCRAIRADAGRAGGSRDAYVIMLTARSSPDAQVEGFHAGADDFLAKPFELADLTASIRAAELVLARPVRSKSA
jgi:DNA-binding response OmpR family regulator